jgi:histidinol-phosphate aminotransferase
MPWFTELLRPGLASIKAYQPALAPPDAIRLDANESPYPLSAAARRELANALAAIDTNRYPDVRGSRLRELIATRSGADPDQIVLGSGSDEAIAIILNALSAIPEARARAATVFPEPSFVMFRISSLVSGLEPVAVPLDANWDLDARAMATAIEMHAPSVVFLPSPNNPTSNLFSDDRIASVIEAARDRSLVLLDEAYGAFAKKSYAELRRAHSHVGQLQTLSKVGLAGARVGWAILPVDLAREVDKARQPYNLNALSQRAAELVLGPLWSEVESAVETILTSREMLAREIAALPGVRVTPSASNFLWVDVGRDAGTVYQALFSRGIIVRSFHSSGGRLARHVRITVGTAEENEKLVSAMKEIVT